MSRARSQVPNPQFQVDAAVRSADQIIWGEVGPCSGNKCVINVIDVLKGGNTASGRQTEVLIGDFDPRSFRTVGAFVLNDDGEILVDPANELLTPLRVRHALESGSLRLPQSSIPEIQSQVPRASAVVDLTVAAVADGTEATITEVHHTYYGLTPDIGDLVKVSEFAAWDLTAGAVRGVFLLAQINTGWEVLVRPFNFDDVTGVDWSLLDQP